MENVTIEDIASYAGVSVSTVSRVLNNHPDVSDKTRERVRNVIESHSYIPNNSARNLKRESLHAVCIIVKGFSNPFFTNMIEVIQEELDRRRYITILHPVPSEEDEMDAAIALNKEKKPEGMIFLGGNFQHAQGKMAKLDIPFVMATITVSDGVDRNVFSSITVDDSKEAAKVARRIYDAGHRHIAAIGYTMFDMSISKLRLGGFAQQLINMGMDMQYFHVDYAGDYTMQGGYEAAKRLLSGQKFSCLFCISDAIALGAMRAIHEAGHCIPDDISIVGFDGIDAARFSIPLLTTIRQPRVEMARQCVRMLLDSMELGEPSQHRVLEAEFVTGESFSRYLK